LVSRDAPYQEFIMDSLIQSVTELVTRY